MSLTSTRRGGLRYLSWIECAGCGAHSSAEPHPEMAWAAARGAGWSVPPSTHEGPWCPDCNQSRIYARQKARLAERRAAA